VLQSPLPVPAAHFLFPHILFPHFSVLRFSVVNAVRLLERRSEGDDPARAKTKYRYWLTSAGRLIAGMKYPDEWQARCRRPRRSADQKTLNK
jgi:hypothetical protein